MKAKVIIENGQTTIVLTPENDFECDMIENVRDSKEKHTIETNFDADYNLGCYSNFKIEMTIKKLP